MCRFSSVAIRASNWSHNGSSVNRPVLRCEIRVASSWKETYATVWSMSRSCVLENPAVMWVMRSCSRATGSTDRVVSK
jgi:hypothetical protein